MNEKRATEGEPKVGSMLAPSAHAGLNEQSDWFRFLPLGIVLTVWTILIAVSISSYRPVTPIPADRSEQFSAHRAFQYLEKIAEGDQRRSIGSPHHDQVAQQITDWLTEFGYQVEAQTGRQEVPSWNRQRSDNQQQVELTNLLAWLPDQDTSNHRLLNDAESSLASRHVLLIVTHYDSVPFGPGASDNGVAVASAIEIARMLSESPARCDVRFLFTDGEELGLLGAKLFVESNPRFKDVGFVINADARGTRGPSLMFETSGGTAELIPMFSRAVRQPRASSLFFEVYKYLPNDTDFTEFKRANIQGFNFAFIGNVNAYHTPEDNLANVDLGSMQHHGENILGLIREISSRTNSKGQLPSTHQAKPVVYFDWLGWRLFWWPEMAGRGIAAMLAVVWLSCAAKAVRLQGGKSLLGGGFMLLVSWILLLVLGSAITWLARLDASLANPWPEKPDALSASIWLGSLAFAASLATGGHRWMPLGSVNLCLVGGWVLLAIGTAFFTPGASFLFLLPALAGVLALLLSDLTQVRRKPGPRPSVVAEHSAGSDSLWRWLLLLPLPLVCGLMWLPLEPLLYDAIGFRFPIAVSFRPATLLLSALPCLLLCDSTWRFSIGLTSAVVAVASLIAAVV